MSDLFKLFADTGYRFGACSIRVYNRHETAVYGANFLHKLYDMCLDAAPSRTYGILPELFCGFTDLSFDAVAAYLHSRSPLLLMCVDAESDADYPANPNSFDVIGFSFPTLWSGPAMNSTIPDCGRVMFMGYMFGRPWWRTPESVVCMMLNAIYYFHQFNLLNLQGQSFPWNHLTRKFLAQFGTKTIGVIPKFLFDGKRMVDSVQSVITREDFEEYVQRALGECSSL